MKQSLESQARHPAAADDAASAAAQGRDEIALTWPQAMQRAEAAYQSGDWADAERLCRTVLKAKADCSDALNLLGIIVAQTQRLQEAAELLGRAVAANSSDATVHCNYGNVLQDLMRLDQAIESYDQAIKLKPDFEEAYNNRGNALKALLRLDEAPASFGQAITLKPDYAEAHHNLSLCRLLMGDFDSGWEEYEWRWKSAQLANGQRNFTQPLWLGKESLTGKTILLHSEQGLGDTLQFCRYAKLVSELGARVILEVYNPLSALLTKLDGVAQLVETGGPLPAVDFHCPLLSLPLAFKTGLNTIPARGSYVASNPGKVTEWHARLGARTKPRIGLVWSGRTEHMNDQNRSIALFDLLKGLPDDYQYISLQKEIKQTDEETLGSRADVLHFGEQLADFTDTAALCELMDVVISVDTSVAHLAGAMGKAVWILLPFCPDWRWLLDRVDSPWYPTATLFRQGVIGDWDGVLGKVQAELLRSLPRHSHIE